MKRNLESHIGILPTLFIMLVLLCAGCSDEYPATPETLTTPEEEAPVAIFNIIYGDEVTEQPGLVIGEEIVDSVDCFIYEYTYRPTAIRKSADGTTPFTLLGGKMWIGKTTQEWVKAETYSKIEDTEVTIKASNLLRIQFPMAVGNEWSFESVSEMIPELAPSYTITYQARIVSREELTVPLGVFDCYRVELSVISMNGVNLDTPVVESTLWLNVDGAGEIKRESYTLWDKVEVAELAYVAEAEEANN